MKKHMSRNCSPRGHLSTSPYTEWGSVSLLLGKCVFGTYYGWALCWPLCHSLWYQPISPMRHSAVKQLLRGQAAYHGQTRAVWEQIGQTTLLQSLLD